MELGVSTTYTKNNIGTEFVKRNLVKEINYWNPKIIITLGLAFDILNNIINDNNLPITVDLENYHPTSRPITKKKTVIEDGEIKEVKITIDTARIRKNNLEFGNTYREEMLNQ